MRTGWASAAGATLLVAATVSLLGPVGAHAADGSVTVASGFYSPSQVTVGVGDSVTWTWNSDNHSVTFINGDDTGVRDSGATFTPAPFPSEGTYVYYCTVHGSPSGGMRGTVVVRRQATPAPTPTKKPTPSPTPSKTTPKSPTAPATSSSPRPTTTTSSADPAATSADPSRSSSTTPSAGPPSTSVAPSGTPSQDLPSASTSPASQFPDSSTVSAADPPAEGGRSNTGLLVVAGAALAGAGLLAVGRGGRSAL